MTERRQLAAWLLALLALPGAARADPALWSVRGDGGTVWLFGAVHALAPGAFEVAGPLATAWQDAESLWLELDPKETESAEGAAVVAARALDPGGRGLDDLLGADAAAIRTAASAAGVDLGPFALFEPWFVATTVTLQGLLRHGYGPDDGVERVLARRALADDKPVHGLERLDEQLALLDGLAPGLQRDLLRQALDEYGRIGMDFARLAAAWQAGDDAVLAALLEQEFVPYPELAEALVFARNRRWAGRVEALLGGGDDALVVVGTLHLVGDRGLPALLAARGYRVRRH